MSANDDFVSQPKPALTGDGSATLFSERFGQHYHSIHGAIQESQHVFLQAGFMALPPGQEPLYVFEMGLGTGLNAWLTWLSMTDQPIHYTAVEAYPLLPESWQQLNYHDLLAGEIGKQRFIQLHQAPWNQPLELSPGFTLQKIKGTLEAFEPEQSFDLVYWDAFAPESQPELWTEEVFARVLQWMQPGGRWVSYSAKGAVRRALQAVGFEVERLPGPPRKREMLRARKPISA